MKILKKLFAKHHFTLQAISCIALFAATITANTRCAFIFHDPKKPACLKQLRKF